MTTNLNETMTLTAKAGSAILKAMLVERFPGCKFSVRSTDSVGAGAIRVTWSDGPSKVEVEKVCSLMEGRGFDGMDDSTTVKNSTFEWRGERFTAPWVFVSTDRWVSMAARREAGKLIEAAQLPGYSARRSDDRECDITVLLACSDIRPSGAVSCPAIERGMVTMADVLARGSDSFETRAVQL
ncbi:MAG TPA: LPD29 domain-containing protein [Ramlibacter sp.]|nr:LPD29 domain-containing protein [Ramlibacter sp.]